MDSRSGTGLIENVDKKMKGVGTAKRNIKEFVARRINRDRRRKKGRPRRRWIQEVIQD